MRPSEDNPSFDRVLGCILGGAIGDALGYPIEFIRSAEEIVSRFGAGPPVYLAYTSEPARISDDTQMTLFSIEGLIRAKQAGALTTKDTTEFLLGAYQRWHATQGMRTAPVPAVGRGWMLREAGLHARRAPGNTCTSALAMSFTRPTPTVDDPPNGSKGCGAVMRSAPFGIASKTREEAFSRARDAGVLTHGHPSGYLSAAYFASLIFDLSRGTPFEKALRGADELLALEREHEETTAAVVRARAVAKAGLLDAKKIEALGGGWVGEEALAIGIACALACRGPEDVATTFWRAVSHAGDSDSTGSIAGNLLGAMYGVGAMPERWLAQLELRAAIERASRDLFASSVLGDYLDTESYPREHGRFECSV